MKFDLNDVTGKEIELNEKLRHSHIVQVMARNEP